MQIKAQDDWKTRYLL